jgi:hypothetical protein
VYFNFFCFMCNGYIAMALPLEIGRTVCGEDGIKAPE